jgi:hypothetical protein
MVTNVSINERESLNSDCQQFHQPISTSRFDCNLIEVVTKAGLTNLIEVVTKAGLTVS